MSIGDEHVEHWREHGYVIVEGFLDDDELSGARDELYRIFPTADRFAADPSAFPDIQNPEWGGAQATVEFPFTGDVLNHMSTKPELVSFVERALGTSDLLMTQSLLWSKYGEGGAAHDQALHFDYNDNSLVVPAEDLSLEQVPAIIYFEDVTAGDGPTHVLSRQHSLDVPLVDNGHPNPFFWSHRRRDRHPELYEHEVAVTVPAGSVMFFSMSTLHRGSAFTSPTGGRFSQHIVYRSAECNWMGWRAWPRYAISQDLVRFVEQATVRERDLLGFPSPGHRYWTDSTIQGTSARYPQMDMAPYVAAMSRPG